MEVLPGATRGRAALTLVVRPVCRAAVRVFGRRAEPEEAELADLHARIQDDRQGRDVGELKRDVAAESGVDEAGRRVGEQTESAQARLALDPGGQVVREGDRLECGAQDELAWMQDESVLGGIARSGRRSPDPPTSTSRVRSGCSAAGSI